MFNRLATWMKANGKNSDIVLSSRVRLARNISGFPFTNRAENKLLREILLQTKEALLKTESFSNNCKFWEVGKLSPIDRFVLMERHLISTELVTRVENGGILVKAGEELSVMINEEDHIRLQSLKSGLNLFDCWEMADKLDNEISRLLEYAFNSGLGYLTACPTNLGTGMRVSVLLHLPALVLSKKIKKTIRTMFKSGYTIRGIYGEGSNVQGTFFQVSSVTTLGKTEIDIITEMDNLTQDLLKQEEDAREMIFKQARYQTEDKIWRSYGILKNAKLLNSEETLNLLSAVRMGVSMGIIEQIPMKLINRVLIFSQPAHIQLIHSNVSMSPEERDVKRATFIRDLLKN